MEARISFSDNKGKNENDFEFRFPMSRENGYPLITYVSVKINSRGLLLKSF